jgi:hypothetical protein
VASLLALGLGTLAAGCAARAARPLAPGAWPANASPPAADATYLVTVYQRAGFWHVALGSGAIVHSCREHGTYVLTAFHVVDESDEAGVWIYRRSRADVPADAEGLERLDAVVIDPAPEDLGWGGAAEALRAMRSFTLQISRDFAVLKLDTEALFHTLAIHDRTEQSLPAGTPVRLGAVPPEEYPHFHDFTWDHTLPADVFQPGHSGGPILLDGKLFALVASTLAGSDIVLQRPSVPEMRRHLEEVGLDFVLRPGTCYGSIAPRGGRP